MKTTLIPKQAIAAIKPLLFCRILGTRKYIELHVKTGRREAFCHKWACLKVHIARWNLAIQLQLLFAMV